jgi:hypothetical protein
MDKNINAPHVTGQCAQVLQLIRLNQPILSLNLTADHAIPEAAARVHDLRNKGFNIITTILPKVKFRGAIRRNVAAYSLGVPEWNQRMEVGAGATAPTNTGAGINRQETDTAEHSMEGSI